MKQIRAHRGHSWTNRNFHISLYLMLFLMFGMAVLGKQQAQIIARDSTPIAHADDKKESKLIDPQPTATNEPSPTSEPTPTIKWEQFKKAVDKIAPVYKADKVKKVVLAQGHLESAQGTSGFCLERNNCLGIGCFDWDPNGNCFYFENTEQQVVEYFRIIRKNFPEAWANRDNPQLYIQYVKYSPTTNLMYATDPDYISKVISLWGQY